jgi:MFS transporter, Spinster family, sphingosine-1-phosphate transporter
MPTQKNPLESKHSLQILQMEPKGIPSNSSNQQLVSGDESDGYPSDSSPSPRLQRVVSRTEWVTVAILCFVNLINYMDRFTVAGTHTGG